MARLQKQSDPGASSDARGALLEKLPISESRRQLAGISTSVLEGGEGPPIVLLHGPGEYAAKWLRIIPALVETHRVIAPDLPGHGASAAPGGELDADTVILWLSELIDATCDEPPVLVGQILGGAVAARFAARHGDRIAHLVLCDALGLAPFEPTPEFGGALMGFLQSPTQAAHEELWNRCAHDLDALKEGMGADWDRLEAYNLDRARDASLKPTQKKLMDTFGMPAIPGDDLARISTPTSLIWGRHDEATSLNVAEAASERHGWPLRVIEGAADDPPIERPEAFLSALREAIGDDGARHATPMEAATPSREATTSS